MVASSTGVPLEGLASDLFDVVTRLYLAVPRGRRGSGDLKDLEFLTLAILHAHDTMIVGDIQRILGVLPAQMSRLIRSLENRERPLIACRINPRDKRKIDVGLTPAGEKALGDYQTHRVRRLVELLRDLPDEEQEEMHRLLHQLADRLHNVLGSV
jgi:DNA-binding MarR family transcriptional regulator